jgi:hypothetical protein
MRTTARAEYRIRIGADVFHYKPTYLSAASAVFDVARMIGLRRGFVYRAHVTERHGFFNGTIAFSCCGWADHE